MKAIFALLLLCVAVAPSLQVNCGGHKASSCNACPQGNGRWWCNGECVWKNGQCVDKATQPAGKCGRSTVQQSRIVNGYDAKPGAWPWIASLQTNSGFHFCGGSLITPTWILTAAHCVGNILKNGASKYRVQLGQHNLKATSGNSYVQTIKIKRVVAHPRYDSSRLLRDFALLELSTPAQLNSRVELACLPPAGVRPKIGRTDCYHAGWGMTDYPAKPGRKYNLQQSMLPIVPVSKCVHNREAVCAGYGDVNKPNACRGDSGGPFMCRKSDGTWQLEGVASYVVTYCKYYTGFSPVNDQISWITSTIKS